MSELWIRNYLFLIRIQLWIFRVQDPNPSQPDYLSIFGYYKKTKTISIKKEESTNYRYRYISAIFYLILHVQSYRYLPSTSSNPDLKALLYFLYSNFAFSFNLKHQLNTEFLYKNNLPHTVMAKFQKELFKISEIV